MKLAAQVLCCALCAALPSAYAESKTSPAPSGKASVKPATKKHKIHHGKTHKKAKLASKAAEPAKPVAMTSGPVVTPAVASPTVSPAAVAASMPLPAPAVQTPPRPEVVKVAARNPYIAEQYAAMPTNPYLAQGMAVPEVQRANPYLPVATATTAAIPVAPVNTFAIAAPAAHMQPATPAVTASTAAQGNSYAPSQAPSLPVAAAAPSVATAAVSPEVVQPSPATQGGLKSQGSLLAKLDPLQSLSGLFNDVRTSIPILNGQDLLPRIKTVYPTGEKPLVILSFKCPTEMVGVSTPPMKALHEIVNYAFDGINKTNLLSFNMQQVCQ
jgi:hypothetical protein